MSWIPMASTPLIGLRLAGGFFPTDGQSGNNPPSRKLSIRTNGCWAVDESFGILAQHSGCNSVQRCRFRYAPTARTFSGCCFDVVGAATDAVVGWEFGAFGDDLLRTVLFLATGVFAFATGIFPFGRTRFCRGSFAPASATAAAPARNSAKLSSTNFSRRLRPGAACTSPVKPKNAVPL